jgi:hypothetical protein
MLAIAALMLVNCLYQVGMHIRWWCWLPSASALAVTTQPAASQPASSQPAASQPPATQASATRGATSLPSAAGSVTQPDAAAMPLAGPPGARPGPRDSGKPPVVLSAAIKKRNIMAEPKPKGHGLRLTGVLGSTALFATREGQVVGIEEGQSGPGGVKVTSIDGYVVTIECEGKPETMRLFADGPEGGGPASGRRGGPGAR